MIAVVIVVVIVAAASLAACERASGRRARPVEDAAPPGPEPALSCPRRADRDAAPGPLSTTVLPGPADEVLYPGYYRARDRLATLDWVIYEDVVGRLVPTPPGAEHLVELGFRVVRDGEATGPTFTVRIFAPRSDGWEESEQLGRMEKAFRHSHPGAWERKGGDLPMSNRGATRRLESPTEAAILTYRRGYHVELEAVGIAPLAEWSDLRNAHDILDGARLDDDPSPLPARNPGTPLDGVFRSGDDWLVASAAGYIHARKPRTPAALDHDAFLLESVLPYRVAGGTLVLTHPDREETLTLAPIPGGLLLDGDRLVRMDGPTPAHVSGRFVRADGDVDGTELIPYPATAYAFRADGSYEVERTGAPPARARERGRYELRGNVLTLIGSTGAETLHTLFFDCADPMARDLYLDAERFVAE